MTQYQLIARSKDDTEYGSGVVVATEEAGTRGMAVCKALETLVADGAGEAANASGCYGEELINMVLALYSGEDVEDTNFPDLKERQLVVAEVNNEVPVSGLDLPPERPE